MMKTRALFRHQREGVDDGLLILLKYRLLAIFFDPGLGKSLTALTIADQLIDRGDIKYLIIVAPKTLFGTWQNQISEHSDFPGAFEYVSTKVSGKKYCAELAEFPKTQKILLINYEAFRDPKPELKSMFAQIIRHSLVVCDESVAIKNTSSQQTKGLTRECLNAWGKIIMTGTELTKSPLDLFSQFEFLRNGFWGEKSFYTFRLHYAILEPLFLPGGKQTTKVVGFRKLNELQKKIEPIVKRAKKEDCLDLPPKVFQTIPVELDPKELRAYNELKRRLITILDTGETISVEQKISLFMRFRTITGGWADTHTKILDTPSKLSVLLDLLGDDDSQAIIWSSFDHEINMLALELKKIAPVSTFYGGNKSSQEDLAEFMAGRTRFFIANPKSGGAGLNLQFCHMQYFYSLTTNAGEYMQSLDRSHRIGTTKPVIYRYLLAKGLIDERIKQLLDQSVDLLHAFQTRDLKELIEFV